MDIHMPSVASSPTPHSNAPQDGNGNAKEDLLALMKEKDNVEAELKALGSVLDSHKVNMQTPLCTFDGYPRDDIDVAQIRIARSRIIHLRNDYKGLMNKIEKGLHAHHATIAASLATTPPSPLASSSTQLIEAPFAKVNTVVPGSPAAEAGMRPGDLIKRFGTVNALNHSRLSRVAELVTQDEGRPVNVLLSRKDDSGTEVNIHVSLTPRKDWGGRGLLGCHLLPL
ncbi:26S proteasome non-ATPase regulatory subunit 9 [Morchella snyderi]|nr:26S proteasome non-ATPase regulatory subunit 9 [Morchella snyderi]